jgi:hypothetical protein
MAMSAEEFRALLTQNDLTYAKLGRKIGRSERTVSEWGREGKEVPTRYESMVRGVLVPAVGEANPLSRYPDYALLDEIARRLRRSPQSGNSDPTSETWINADPD